MTRADLMGVVIDYDVSRSASRGAAGTGPLAAADQPCRSFPHLLC